MQKETFRIQELDCAEECNLLNKALKGREGIERLDFDVINGEMHVTYDPQKIDSGKILEMIRSTGMQASLQKDKPESLSFWQKHGRLILCSASGFFLLLGFIFHLIGPTDFGDVGGLEPNYEFPELHVAIFYLLAIVCGGWFVAPKALASAKRLSPDMNVLMVVAVFGAIAIGQMFEGAAVTFLFSLALLLESWSVDRARKAISALLDLSPTLARVMTNGELIEKKVEDVELGARVLVRPGEKVPLDGEVVAGSSSLNQAPITGESMPVSKEVGDAIFAGTINEDGALEMTVTKGANDTTLARIIQMVQDARQRRAKSEQWVDRFSRVYTPIMMVLALVVGIAPPLFFGQPWMEWIYRGLVMLVIACPCALVISTPVSIVSALTAAARSGVLIKGGVYLEAIGKLTAIAFDKTGTVTIGKPKVQRIVPLNGHTEDDLLEIAAKLEKPSEHPLARAILEKANEKGIQVEPAQDYQIFKGLGAEGTIDGDRFWIGSHRFMHEQKRKESPEAHGAALEMEDAGHSVVAIGDFTHICGLFSIADEARPNISATLSAIEDLGVKKLVMLTGDNQKTAETLAKQVGLKDYYAELMPEDKVSAIEELKKEHEVIAMVGDGVNDAPAMAASSFGIAMGAMGTDAAFETADVVLMTDDLAQLPWVIRHARKTLKIIKENIIFALSIKGLFILLALFGLATLWMAIAADTGASLLVVFNGLRLLKRGTWKFTAS
ncbi:MAG: heavy metal translocating P-type ATPase [Simkaniaceae bacterium]|nr:heavy metal translocating P-type ATPase [Candidatus Sacchlamyda saccharinae]